MTKQATIQRIKVLETKLNAMTFKCPLRYKVKVVEEIRKLRATL